MESLDFKKGEFADEDFLNLGNDDVYVRNKHLLPKAVENFQEKHPIHKKNPYRKDCKMGKACKYIYVDDRTSIWRDDTEKRKMYIQAELDISSSSKDESVRPGNARDINQLGSAYISASPYNLFPHVKRLDKRSPKHLNIEFTKKFMDILIDSGIGCIVDLSACFDYLDPKQYSPKEADNAAALIKINLQENIEINGYYKLDVIYGTTKL